MAITQTIVLMLMALSMGYVIRGWRHGYGYGYYHENHATRRHATDPHAHTATATTAATVNGTGTGTAPSIPSEPSNQTLGSTGSFISNDGNVDHNTATTSTISTATAAAASATSVEPSKGSSKRPQLSSQQSSEVSSLSSPKRWSVIPQGWSDDEEYDAADEVTCTTELPMDAHLRNKLTISMLSRLGVNITHESTKSKGNQKPKQKPRALPWWYPRLVQNSPCQHLTSMKHCHQTSLTCQWSLQGYCFNYSAPSIGWFQAEAYPGGLTNQEVSALKGLAIARYVQSKLYDTGVIATLISRLHRQSPTDKVKLVGANNDLKDFRPFRHFFDPASVYCPVDMGPIIERPRLVLINSMTVNHFLPAPQSPLFNMKLPNGTSVLVPRPGPLLCLNRSRMGTFKLPFCEQSAGRYNTQNRSDELVSHYRNVLLSNSSVPHLGIITRTWWCRTNFMWYPINRQLRFSPRWYRIAKSVTNAFARNSSSSPTIITSPLTNATKPKLTQLPYIGLHLRREDDICRKKEASVFFCAWTPQQWMKCLNSFLIQDGRANISIGYIATDRSVVESDWYAPFRNGLVGNIQWHTKSSLIGVSHGAILKRLRREELAIVDQLVLSQSAAFAGVARSSFSQQIASNRRDKKKKGLASYLLDRRPPKGCRGVEL